MIPTGRLWVPVFQMLYASETLEATVDHDSQSIAQCFAFFHTVYKMQQYTKMQQTTVSYLTYLQVNSP